MKIAGLVALAGMLTTASTLAVPLDITFNLGAPAHEWGSGSVGFFSYQYDDTASIANQTPSDGVLNLAGVNSINVTWNAPAGYMFVVKPPPADIGALTLELETSYGYGLTSAGSLVASLGNITSQSLSVHTIYGSSPLSGGVNLSTFSGDRPALNVLAQATINPGSAPFAFNSITVSADFSGRGAHGSLDESGNWDGIADYGAVLFGVNNFSQYGIPYTGPGDPGQLFTLEPISDNGGGDVPDNTSTLSLAGIGFVGLVLVGRKFVAGQ